jgi:hypothetical protein
MIAIHPRGFITVLGRIVAKGKQSVLCLTFDSGLVEKKRKAPIQDELDISNERCLIRERIRLEPKPGCPCPAASELGKKVMRAI